jgi:hypothetical protein
MIRRISTILILTTLLFALIAMTAFAAKSPNERQNNKVAIKIADYAFPDEYNYYPSSGEETRVSLDKTKSPAAGFGYKLGETHYEWQHNSTMGRQLIWGSDTECPWTLHADWMYLPSGLLVDRQILYNAWDGSAGVEIGIFDQFQGGGDYAGYPSIAVTGDNRAVVAAHNDVGTTGKYAIQAWWQFGCNQSLFSYTVALPDSLDECGNTALDLPGDDDYVWPKIAIQSPPDGEMVTHLIGSVFGGGSGQQAFGYFQKVGDNAGGDWTFGCAIDTIGNGESYDLSTGTEGEIGIVWQARLAEAGCDTCSENASSGDIGYDRLNGDLYMQVNRNYGRGILGAPYQPDAGQPNPNWWENRVNITRHVGDEQTGRNGFRPYSDLSAVFTTDNILHVAYIGMIWEYPDFGTYRCRLFHWSEDLGFDVDGIPNIRTVASAQWEVNICNPGAFKNNMAKMSISECDGKLYVMWVEYNSPNTTGNENHDDCAFRAFEEGGGDFSGAANGDLFVSVSADLGLTWDFPRNLTDTYGGPTGNPNGACDPGGTAGPCPAENWPSMTPYGTNYAVTMPDPSNLVDIDENPPYGGSYYLDVSYLDDIDPGGAVMDEGGWYNTDLLWIRFPCVEPVSAAGFVMGPTNFDYPSCVKHCEVEPVDVTVENTGNDGMTMTVFVEEDPSAFSGWLTATGFPSSIPSGFGNVATGSVNINAGGAICAEGTVVHVTGRVLFDHNAPTDVDTFFVDLIVADTCVLPSWDTIATNCTELIVGTNGNAGNGGAPGGKNLDYVDEGVGEWLAANAAAAPDVYLYDAGTIAGSFSDDDTMMYWGMFQVTIADNSAMLPLHDTTALARIPAHFTEVFADGFYTGLYTNGDSTLGFEAKWYANTDDAYSCGFVVKETKVYSLDGAAHDGLVLGEACDWDVPSDSSSSDNTSGTGGDLTPTISNLMYQQGTEWEDYNDTGSTGEDENGGWDETERYGAMYFLRGYSYDSEGKQTNIQTDPYGMYSASNAKYVYPYELGFNVDSLFKNHAQSGQTVSDSVDTDLHMGMTFLFQYNLAAGDTLYFYTAYLTNMNATVPTASGGVGIAQIAVDAMGFFETYLMHEEGCCVSPGDANHDGGVDISDLTYYVDYMFGGGPEPVCPEEFDNNNDCALDISDLTYYVDYMFGGGPDPEECMNCPGLH